MKLKPHKSEFKPSLGRIVHYQDKKDKKPMAAIIIVVREGEEPQKLGSVDLNVFDPNSSGGHLARAIPQWHKIKEGHWWSPQDQIDYEISLKSQEEPVEESDEIEEEDEQ